MCSLPAPCGKPSAFIPPATTDGHVFLDISLALLNTTSAKQIFKSQFLSLFASLCLREGVLGYAGVTSTIKIPEVLADLSKVTCFQTQVITVKL